MKKFLGAVLGAVLLTNTAFAMNFSQPVEIGRIGFPVQAPYNGFIVERATSNSGGAFLEEDNTKTYVRGVAQFGGLYCDYDFDAEDFLHSLKFGGENNYVVALEMSFKEIQRILSDENLTLYVLYHEYCTSHLNLIGEMDGRWFNFVDSKNLSAEYFGGNDGYKMDGSVVYERPKTFGGTIVIPYHRWHWEGDSETEGEFRLKWDEAAQWFSVEQIVY